MSPELLSLLTWKDIEDIIDAADGLMDKYGEDIRSMANDFPNKETFYEAVLQRLNGRTPCGERYASLLPAAEAATGTRLTERRSNDNTLVRVFLAYRLSEEGYGLSEIGRAMGRNHSTISHLIKRFRDMLLLPIVYKEEIALYKRFEGMI